MPTWPTIAVQIAFNSDSVEDFVQADLVTAATWLSVTSYVLAFGYTRGRQRQLGRAEAGTAYLILDNETAEFDPENSSSTYYLSGRGMMPGKHVRIQATYNSVVYSLFYGFVTAWEPEELSRGTGPRVRVTLTDQIGWLARAQSNVVTAAALSGTAIAEVLTDQGVAAAFQNLDDGALSSSAVSETTSPWSVVQSMADGEEGALVFIDGAGRYTYHDHTRRYAQERSIVYQATFDNAMATVAAGTTLPFTRVRYARDDAELFARADVTRAGGTTQSVTSSTLNGRYYNRATSKSTRNVVDASAQNLAARIVARSRALWEDHALAQHTGLEVEAGIGSASLWPKVLGLEISDLIRVTERLYPGTRTRTIPSFIEGMTVDVDMDRLTWKTAYRLSRALEAFHWIIGGKGVAFPSSPTTNDLFYRTDLGLLCFYDGSRWLTAHEYTAPFGDWNAGGPYSTSGSSPVTPWHTDYNPWITRAYYTLFVNGTNNGSNYWTVTLTTGGGTSVWASNTSALSGSTVYTVNQTVSATYTTPGYFYYNLTTTGTPGALRFVGSFRYRLVVT